MFGTDNEARLVDFGLAKETVSKMKTFAGTPYFMAPEVLNGSYGAKCDVWSLGCVLYMLASGKLPFDGQSKTEVFTRIKLASYRPIEGISDELVDLIS